MTFIFQIPITAQVVVTTFSAPEAIPTNVVFSIFEDEAHILWVGTSGGLGQYHENNWAQLTESNSPLINNHVKAIIQDHNGYLWFGTDHGLSQYYQGAWQNFTYAEMSADPKFDQITSLYLDSRSKLWIGSKEGGVVKRSGSGSWTYYSPADAGFGDDMITAICEDNNNRIWFGTGHSGIVVFDRESEWSRLQAQPEIGDEIHLIYKDNLDTLWVNTEIGLARTFDGIAWNSTGLEMVHDASAIAEDQEGNIWLATENGELFLYNRYECKKSDVQFDQAIWSLHLDHAGYLWAATNGGGVSRLHINWRTFLQDYIISDIDEDTSGTLWIGTARNGIAKYDGSEFQMIQVKSDLIRKDFVNSILADHENRIWCGTRSGVFSYDQDTSWHAYGEPELPNVIVNTIFQDTHNHLWFGTLGGASRFDGTDWQTFDREQGLPDTNVKAIWEDHKGHIWFGTANGGACELKLDSVIAIYNIGNQLSSNNVSAILQDKTNNYWFGTKDGLHRSDSSKVTWSHFTKESSGLVDNDIKTLFVDDYNNVWVGTSAGGLCKFDGQFWWDFNKYLSADEVNAVFQDASKNYWFGTPIGLVKYSADKLAPNTYITIAPSCTIGVASAMFAFIGDDNETPKEKLVFSWDLQLKSEFDVHNWSDYSDRNYCYIGPLGNGNYTFSVKARDSAGNEDHKPAQFDSFTVDITPPQTMLTYPANNQKISGKVPVIGAVFDNSPIRDFKMYQLDYARIDSAREIQALEWVKIYQDTIPSDTNKTLFEWDTADVGYGRYSLRLSAADYLEHRSEYRVDVTIVECLTEVSNNSGSSMIGSSKRIQLYIPPGALPKDMMVHFSPVDTSDKNKIPVPPNDHVKYSSLAYELGPKDLSLSKPAILGFQYNDSEISSLHEKKLSIMFADSTGEYEILGGSVDSDQNTISTAIKKMGVYILIEDNTSARAKSNISDVNCQPRIFSPRGSGFAETTTILFKLSAPSKVNVKVYNLAGRLVKQLLENELLNANYNTVEWDGRDYNGDICPSDLYIITIESGTGLKTKTVMVLDKEIK
ncbi:MAG: two-component regulator propeller domain-containing protein [Candidatus Zhuqueibacterota bacterium]